MNKIIECSKPSDDLVTELMSIWFNAVKTTHHFLSDEEINKLHNDVKVAMKEVDHLFVYTIEDQNAGFIGINSDKVEMIFVSDKFQKKGVGSKLMNYVIENYQIKYIDVNKENEVAYKFYQHLGFEILKKSEFDKYGNPFPVYHLIKH
ncbi:GNAT family N-acetyltransferase [Erysipelotrichaceae bacterium OttesenSCG-928-M19]|nr:GNAT family N-acetyltransferase [Erysipelotrichaceae bacterium OttesenSCG-928-M19]